MTNPEQPAGPAHPARAAGYALIGVAVVALVIGLISLFTGGPGDDPSTAQSTPPADTSTASAGPTTAVPPGETTTPAPSSDTPQPTTGAPTTTGETPGGTPTGTPGATPGGTNAEVPPPPVDPAPKPSVRIYNNSTTQGLAGRASDDVLRAGWQVAEKGNYSQGTIPTTTVYFRPGTDEEASATELARILKARVEPRFNGIESAQPGIIVIVTNDYQGPSGKAS
ncbi:LytR C-terminal domain-containing protein [Saccharothrix sp. HUAS TT1]|uniref:LytR C-terminal domain-containing protein n=1 Tax=unclassified Saccharothrix TaxID=2593673 RepID=UPI00345C279E